MFSYSHNLSFTCNSWKNIFRTPAQRVTRVSLPIHPTTYAMSMEIFGELECALTTDRHRVKIISSYNNIIIFYFRWADVSMDLS